MKEKIDRAKGIVADVLETVKQRGAYQAEVAYAEGNGLSVSTRSGQVDTVEHNDDRNLSVTVYLKNGSDGSLSKGSASTAILDKQAIDLTIDKALAIAGLTEADPHAGLAEKERLAREFRDLQTWQPQSFSADALIARALAAETAASEQGVTVDQSGLQCGESFSVLGNSRGFLASHSGSTASASVVALAEKDGAMERDYWWDASRSLDNLQDATEIGRQAAERTFRRVGARKIASGNYPVIFEAPVAKSLVGHLLQAISGSALYQDASFLKGSLGKRLFPEWFAVHEDPFMPGGFASRNFDSDGVQTQARKVVENGILNGYLLSTYAARRLGMESTGNAGGSHNIRVQATSDALPELLQKMDSGLLVTEVMGQGVNLVTGDYSRGASGFWIENGAIQFPVNEITIAGNLQDMFSQLQAVGKDIDRRSKIETGSWLIERMAIAGE